MSGSRSKKSGGQYDDPGYPTLIDTTKYENIHDYGTVKPEVLGSGGASQAGKILSDRKEKIDEASGN